MKSLYRAHEVTTESTISQVQQIGHTADKAHVELKKSVDRVIEKIQHELQIRTSKLNEVLLNIATKDAFLPRHQSQLRDFGAMRFSQISEKQVERKIRQKLRNSYDTSLEVLKKLEEMCLDLRADRNKLQKVIARCTDSWVALWYRTQMECCFPSLPRLERRLMGNQYLLDWIKQISDWAKYHTEFAKALGKLRSVAGRMKV